MARITRIGQKYENMSTFLKEQIEKKLKELRYDCGLQRLHLANAHGWRWSGCERKEPYNPSSWDRRGWIYPVIKSETIGNSARQTTIDLKSKINIGDRRFPWKGKQWRKSQVRLRRRAGRVVERREAKVDGGNGNIGAAAQHGPTGIDGALGDRALPSHSSLITHHSSLAP